MKSSAEMLSTAEADGIESIEEVLREPKFVAANREKCVTAGKEMYGVLARYANSEALTMVKSVSEMDGVRAWARLHVNYNSRRTLGIMFRVQREWHVFEACEGCRPCAIGIHAMGGEVGGDDLTARRRCEDPGSMENVRVAGDLSKGCEGADFVEVGRSRRELREPQGEGDIIHVEQSRAGTRSEGNSSADGARLRQWRDRRCYSCGMMAHFARDCRTRSKGKGMGKDDGKGYGNGMGKTM